MTKLQLGEDESFPVPLPERIDTDAAQPRRVIDATTCYAIWGVRGAAPEIQGRPKRRAVKAFADSDGYIVRL
jgi:hypothetical protein